jgi:hypothetical protein
VWSALFLFCFLAALAAFGISRRLSRPHRRLGFSFGILSIALAVPIGLVAAFETFMCSSETTGQGDLAKANLVWFIERQGCGATMADVYTVRVGPHAWWSHRLFTSDSFPIPQAVEAAGENAVRIVIDRDSAGENAPPEGLVVPISRWGKPAQILSFDRGMLQ